MSEQALTQYRPNLRVKPRTFTITESDFDTVRSIGAYLNCSNSEAVRTAIRTYAAHIAYMEQKKKPS